MVNQKKRTPPPRPTDLELAILRVLWQHGSISVREVLNRLNQERQTEAGYTTVLKMLQIMTEKGLVNRDDSERPQIYSARLTQQQTQRQLVSDLLARAFDGSAKGLVMQALAAKEASAEDLAQIEQILNKLEGDDK
ncbi:MAG: BlaI/MecI/CopY family transcriptional regulator [Acidobacteriota bacterium]|nr:BlaI/MecI/CopY family transcriptional regulator [Acidobacteriota bacterium]MDQ3651233.1 BlaI/MecI/CopY family transcriptional regulator [Acidobacteriota bacterium]